jgi:hypothetical protein
VTRTMWIALALLCVAGFLMIARRSSEHRPAEPWRDAGSRRDSDEESLKDSIDWEELAQAEDEIRDVDPLANPEDGFEGDDWGPGTVPKMPKPPLF